MNIYLHRLIFGKDNANERKENLFSISRVQLILCKDKKISATKELSTGQKRTKLLCFKVS